MSAIDTLIWTMQLYISIGIAYTICHIPLTLHYSQLTKYKDKPCWQKIVYSFHLYILMWPGIMFMDILYLANYLCEY
jgi:hypothetical protein